MNDLTIIGGGAAGCHAAALAAKAGFSVVLVEGDALGGCAAHEGYWPYHRLLDDAALLHKARSGILGMMLNSGTNVYLESVERMRSFTEALMNDTKENLLSLGVNIVRANGHVNGLRNHRYVVNTGDNFYESRRLLLCMGSVAAIPKLPGIDKSRQEGFALSPAEQLSAKLPMKAVVLGGTLNDLKIAAWLAANRASVVLVSPHDRIASELDPDICVWLSQHMSGVQFIKEAVVAAVESNRVVLSERGGGRSIDCDRIVTGGKRYPATRGIGLNNAAIATDNGAVITDLTCHTNLPDVYAAGDVNMRSLSALGAFREAEVCVANMLGQRQTMAYNALPYIFDCGVKAASVGETEQRAEAMGCRVITSVKHLRGRRENGFVKLVADERSCRLMGAHICGYAEDIEIIRTLASLLETGCDIQEARYRIQPRGEFSDAVAQALMFF